ncbi:hypothetical protein V5799_019728, partial [Amblyomma americanum]
AAPKRQTRSTAKGAKKRSSTKKALANDENSSKSSEDPEKENIVEVQLKTATKGARKKAAPVIKIQPVTPLSEKGQGGTQPKSLRPGRQTRAQAKALSTNSQPQTPPQGAGVVRALLFSSAKRTATPSKQLFSPYAKCSVQEKARAFESKEPISPKGAEPAKCSTVQSEASAATPVNRAGLWTPVPPSPLQAMSVQITERGTLTTAQMCAMRADVHCDEILLHTPVKERRSTRASRARVSTSDSHVPSQAITSPVPEAPTATAVPEEGDMAPSVPEPAATTQKRLTRASVVALALNTAAEEVPEAVPGCSATKPETISPRSSSSSSSPATSESDDEEWVESPTSPKHTRLLPRNIRIGGAGVRKLSGVRGMSTKMVGKDRTAATPNSVRKISANSSFKVPFATPKHATPSKLVRPVPTSETRPGTTKALTSEEPSRKRHDSGSSEAERQRKQEILRLKMDATKKERELRLARVQAQREQREAERRELELQRQREAQQKEQERLKQRTEFHQRKQSERSLNVDTLAAAMKRRAESPLVSASKKACPLKTSKTAKVTRAMGGDKEAAMLVFGQPSTSLAQKAKLNNSLQQQAMLNSLSQSLRNQSSFLPSPEQPQAASGSQSITELVESSPAKLNTALNTTMTLSAADKPVVGTLDQTFTMPAPAAATEPTTPSPANSTFVRNSGPPRSSGYDITPHRSELPPQPNKDKDNYDIEDLNSGDDTDDDEKPRKEVPLWAKGTALQALVLNQSKRSLRGLDLFGKMPVTVLDKIFKEQKKYFSKRTSSALWN